MKTLQLTVLALLLVLGSCSTTKVYNPHSDSSVIAHDTQGAVTLRGYGPEVESKKGKGDRNAVKLAQKKALQQLFYFGFVGTDFKNPMIRKGESVETKHKAYFDKFWESGYLRFVTDSKDTLYECKDEKNCVSASSVFTINYNMLRKEFENNKIINKIGF
ncbi:hypothetical protein SCB49_04795 [unidentified eubacterium SCB49]|nr:hypothetical protein SCB49_04795 [unidentified eubacterium SCB49]